MAVSDSLAASSIYTAPKAPSRDEERLARLRERGANLVDCPRCCAPGAEREPEVRITRAGAEHLQSVTRCAKCGPQLETRPAPPPISREESAPMISDRGPDEDLSPVRPALCPCGCKGTPKPDRRFADRSCALRWNKANGILGGRKKGSPTAGGRKKSPPPPEPPANPGTSDEFAPGAPAGGDAPSQVDLNDPSTWHPGGIVEMSAEQLEALARTRRVPSGLEQAKAYLRKLTPEGRQALLALVAAEERCQALGVA